MNSIAVVFKWFTATRGSLTVLFKDNMWWIQINCTCMCNSQTFFTSVTSCVSE